jgi:hypothetical protein
LCDKTDFATYPEKSSGRCYFVIESHFFAAWSGSSLFDDPVKKRRSAAAFQCSLADISTCRGHPKEADVRFNPGSMCGAPAHVCLGPVAEIRE